MNKFMKKLMKKDGFTLVELIVVIAILAILAGVAVPAYSGYINKAQEAGLITELDAIATAAQAANATKGEITGITVVAGTSGVKVTVKGVLSDSFDKDFVLFYDDAVADSTTADQGDFTVADIELVGKYAEKAEDKTGYIVSAGATWSSDGWTEGVVEKDESHTCTYAADAQTGEHKCACGESHASTENVSDCTVCNSPDAGN